VSEPIEQLPDEVGQHYVRFHELARTLRQQCPWDRQQDHQSLRRYLIEETYEVVDAIDRLDADDPATDAALVEELGDLLYQIEFHATIAEQQGRFDITDVTSGVHDKLVARHPHVFSEVEATDADQVVANWETRKRAEKGRSSVFDGVPPALPALSYADKVQRRAATVGFDWPDVGGALPKIAEESAELVDAATSGDERRIEDELGDLLFAVVNVARHLGVDSEVALRKAAKKFQDRFTDVEELAAERGAPLDGSQDLETLDALWNEVKVGSARARQERPFVLTPLTEAEGTEVTDE